MKLTLKRKAELNVSNWSGGSTTELLIYPASSTYMQRNFDVRISSATVEDSPSTFTELTGYSRLLMPLSAPLTLRFNDSQTAFLKPFETIAFDGASKTVSTGVCTDIGIMHKNDYLCHMQAIQNGKHNLAEFFTCIYALKDNVAITCLDQSATLNNGDFLIIEKDHLSTCFNIISQTKTPNTMLWGKNSHSPVGDILPDCSQPSTDVFLPDYASPPAIVFYIEKL